MQHPCTFLCALSVAVGWHVHFPAKVIQKENPGKAQSVQVSEKVEIQNLKEARRRCVCNA